MPLNWPTSSRSEYRPSDCTPNDNMKGQPYLTICDDAACDPCRGSIVPADSKHGIVAIRFARPTATERPVAPPPIQRTRDPKIIVRQARIIIEIAPPRELILVRAICNALE